MNICSIVLSHKIGAEQDSEFRVLRMVVIKVGEWIVFSVEVHRYSFFELIKVKISNIDLDWKLHIIKCINTHIVINWLRFILLSLNDELVS